MSHWLVRYDYHDHYPGPPATSAARLRAAPGWRRRPDRPTSGRKAAETETKTEREEHRTVRPAPPGSQRRRGSRGILGAASRPPPAAPHTGAPPPAPRHQHRGGDPHPSPCSPASTPRPYSTLPPLLRLLHLLRLLPPDAGALSGSGAQRPRGRTRRRRPRPRLKSSRTLRSRSVGRRLLVGFCIDILWRANLICLFDQFDLVLEVLSEHPPGEVGPDDG
jgi:hypothetical protein